MGFFTMGGRADRKKKAKADKLAAAAKQAEEAAAVAAKQEEAAVEADFMSRVAEAEKRDEAKMSRQHKNQVTYWQAYFGDLFHEFDVSCPTVAIAIDSYRLQSRLIAGAFRYAHLPFVLITG